MGVVIEIYIKYPGGRPRIRGTGLCRWKMSVKHIAVKFLAVSLPKRPCFNSETAVQRFHKRNRHLDPEVVFKIR